MFQIDRCIHRNSHMIKEGQKIQRRDKKQTLKKYSSQENKARDKDKEKPEQTQKTTPTSFKSRMNSGTHEG